MGKVGRGKEHMGGPVASIMSQIIDHDTGVLTAEAKDHIDSWLEIHGNLYGSRCPWGHAQAASATNSHLVCMPAVSGIRDNLPELDTSRFSLFVVVTCTLCGHSELYNVARVFSKLAD